MFKIPVPGKKTEASPASQKAHINEIALAIAPFTYNSKGYFSEFLISSIMVTSDFCKIYRTAQRA